ncbi:MAG: ATP-binding protein [Polyangiales bacterium]
MQDPETAALFRFSRELLDVRTLHELFDRTRAEVERSSGYRTIWFAVIDSEESSVARIVDVAGASRDSIYDNVTTIPVAGDALLLEVMSATAPVVVVDALTDPRTNKDFVAMLGNRTIINVPLRVLNKACGALGIGTFGDEGCRAPTAEMLAHFMGIASIVSLTVSRLLVEERSRRVERERREIDRRVARLQRLESVGVLAGSVAHDFNNLLTVVLASTSLARSAGSVEEMRVELAAIDEVATRGQSLTRQLLAMSRAQALALVDLDVSALLHDLVPLLRRVIPPSIAIDLIAPERETFIEADRTQIDQVVMNLCLNARDAMTGGGKLTIESEVVLVNGAFRETHPWAKPGRYVLISVSDTGEGISKENLDRIFDPFFTTKGEHAGTGLGLSVAHGIVHQHGGMLHCYSEEGIGTTFKVYLPLLARAARAVGSKLEGRVRGGNERVLVADDDATVRGVVRRLLERAGYDVTVVPDGAEVLRVLAQEAFDLLLLDVVMPGASCAETLSKARALQPRTRVVLASGYTADANLSALLRDKGIPLLHKPYDPDGLLRALRAELDRP